MSDDRAKQIEEARLRQSSDELQRKADKARNRARLWTQEELDMARVQSRELIRQLRFEDDST